MKLDNLLIITKRNDPEAEKCGIEICEILAEKNIKFLLNPPYDWIVSERLKFACVICIGGDGTILGISRIFAGTGIPLMGINFGNVGFLCVADNSAWPNFLDSLLSSQLPLEKLLALKWKIRNNKKDIMEGVAANDVVLSRNSLARIINLEMSINHSRIGILRGDGVICYTPLGSSGYNLSAGGSIIQANLDVFGCTPVCSYMNSVSPFILEATSRISFKLLKNSANCYITIDGQTGHQLKENDEVEIWGWQKALTFFGNYNQIADRIIRRSQGTFPEGN